MMASEFSRSLIEKWYAPNRYPDTAAVNLVDESLQEVREVLAEVVREHDDPMSEYGCTTHTTERVRTLLSRLEIK